MKSENTAAKKETQPMDRVALNQAVKKLFDQ